MNFNTFDEFCSDVAHNISGPTTIAMAHADNTMGNFITGLGNGSGYRAIGLINFSYSTWRCAAVMAKAGSFAQTPSMLRLCLEAVWYALLVKEDARWLDTWNRMGESNTAKDKIRNGALRAGRAVMCQHNPVLNEAMIKLYDELIAIGGHPNLDAIELMTILDLKEGEEVGRVFFSQLGDEAQRHLAEMNVLRTAQKIVKSFSVIWPDRYLLLGYEKICSRMDQSILTYIHINETRQHRRYEPPR